MIGRFDDNVFEEMFAAGLKPLRTNKRAGRYCGFIVKDVIDDDELEFGGESPGGTV